MKIVAGEGPLGARILDIDLARPWPTPTIAPSRRRWAGMAWSASRNRRWRRGT
ncbi:hypothetical protein WJ971_30985 [Achromobacter xylosoxidans]